MNRIDTLAESKHEDGLRIEIRHEIAGIAPMDTQEKLDIEDTLAWIDSGAELFRRQKPDVPPKHLIVYFAVVDKSNILLVNHSAAGRWLPAGGHVDPGEHPRASVVREANEELGLSANFLVNYPLMLTQTHTVGATAGHLDVSLWYVLKASQDMEFQYDHSEFGEIQWYPFESIPAYRSDPELPRFLSKLRNFTTQSAIRQ